MARVSRPLERVNRTVGACELSLGACKITLGACKSRPGACQAGEKCGFLGKSGVPRVAYQEQARVCLVVDRVGVNARRASGLGERLYSVALLIAWILHTFLQSHKGIEIAAKEPVLDHTIFFKFALRMILGDFSADAPGVLQHLSLIR